MTPVIAAVLVELFTQGVTLAVSIYLLWRSKK